MRHLTLAPFFDIQLFGEGAGGGDGGTGVGAAGEAPAGQNTAAPAQPQPGAKRNPLADVVYGKQEDAPAAGEQKPVEEDRNAKFEALIKGEYKDLYESRVRDTIKSRLKGNEDIVRKHNNWAPVREMLASVYGLDAADDDAIIKAALEDDHFYESSALDEGLSVQQAKEIRKMQRENRSLKARVQEYDTQQQADALYAAWVQDAERVKQIYPGFDLTSELQNDQFQLLLKTGIPIQTAFEVIHKDEILPAAMQYAAQQVTEKVANSVAAGKKRPAEGAMSNRSAVVSKSDVSQLTKADREEIARRVARGERIVF